MSADPTAPPPAPADADALLRRVLTADPPPYALLYRPTATGVDQVELLTGPVRAVDRVGDLPVPESAQGPAGPDVLALLPYRQLAERGFPAPDDGSPLLAMTVRERACLSRAELLDRVPDVPIRLSGEHFDIDDDAYADLVRRVLADEISTGEGANFVIKRRFVADVTDYTPATAAAVFRRLLAHESGAYWTFLVHTGERTLVGASPERHVSLRDGTAVMNPISGTYRYPAGGPTLDGVMDFLDDRKETYELFMVVDEELKMMSRFCDAGVRVVGPFLKEMARLAHTEYFIEGTTRRDVREILRGTLFAPTVTGSPLQSASRVINRYEPQGRGYYSGVVALIGRDGHGGRTLDSSIVIRTADIDASGRMSIAVGATLVRDSLPAAEVAETHAKAFGLLSALRAEPQRPLGHHPSVRSALLARNADISRFWRDGPEPPARRPALAGRRVLVVDAEDTFTSMIAHQLRSTGLEVTVRRFDEPYDPDGHDLVVMGPGPGDPLAVDEPRMAHLHDVTARLLAGRRPFLSVCLSHQVLCHRLGLDVRRRDRPHQGVQKDLDLFGRRERVGFYNSFVAHSGTDLLHPVGNGPVEVCRDAATGEVHAVRGPHFAGVQFHAESVLTHDGVRILGTLLTDVLQGARSLVGS
ncbi:anthranilate synthase family protein [Streptomyces spectabilis]|uniref:anthranilate synthase n=1 Tax=Streptomyces spectabilis TaxID=68270 RepID=A0A5P2XHY3_STRST|nr:anthranilate synthase family protein [Streptomyces spectabilis]MBB5104535.1 phenazine biosynthesis protein phzE [Streptomyces spectabilis]MCI3905110.1 anthranilate synthase family protein [Streptomyces spectabilis]QEV62126.1 phenazine-specific anthranilate synthase component I [Streptomyces spectabilis]GGV00584.1 phenazine-specific anthranilate synthase component I [Streptomyces spectabilis]